MLYRAQCLCTEHLSGMGIVQAFVLSKGSLASLSQLTSNIEITNIQSIFAYSVFFGHRNHYGASAGIDNLVQRPAVANPAWRTAGHHRSIYSCLNLLFQAMGCWPTSLIPCRWASLPATRVFTGSWITMMRKKAPEGYYMPTGQDEWKYCPLKMFPLPYIDGQWVWKMSGSRIKEKRFAIVGHTGSGKTILSASSTVLYHSEGAISRWYWYKNTFLPGILVGASRMYFCFRALLWIISPFAIPKIPAEKSSCRQNDWYARVYRTTARWIWL